MAVYEADLPGVGKKFEIEVDGDTRLIIVIHNTGRREVFIRDKPGEDSQKLFELSDDLARQVGTILEGAYFQPVQAGTIDTLIGEDTVIDWVQADEGSPVIGQSLRDARIRQETGVSVIAIQREDETITNPDPDTTIHANDTFVVLGTQDDVRQFVSFLTPDESTA